MTDWIRDLVTPSALAVERAQAEADRANAVRQAMNLRKEVEAFERRWPQPPPRDALAPQFTWSQLERQLSDLADTPVKAAMAKDLVSATRKLSRFKPPEMVLREILCMTWVLLDEDFDPEPGAADPTL